LLFRRQDSKGWRGSGTSRGHLDLEERLKEAEQQRELAPDPTTATTTATATAITTTATVTTATVSSSGIGAARSRSVAVGTKTCNPHEALNELDEAKKRWTTSRVHHERC
jgi:hypothetical protein